MPYYEYDPSGRYELAEALEAAEAGRRAHRRRLAIIAAALVLVIVAWTL